MYFFLNIIRPSPVPPDAVGAQRLPSASVTRDPRDYFHQEKNTKKYTITNRRYVPFCRGEGGKLCPRRQNGNSKKPKLRPRLACLLLVLLSSTVATSAAGSDQTSLLSGRAGALHGGRVSNVLMVSSSVGVLHRVTCHTTDGGPALPLGLGGVVGGTSLQEGLLGTSSSGDDSDLC